jgi:hypothetical protein
VPLEGGRTWVVGCRILSRIPERIAIPIVPLVSGHTLSAGGYHPRTHNV